MSSVIAYLRANPTKLCDFRTFKAEVNDIDALVAYLKTPDASAIKTLAFKTAISQVAKAKLAEAAAVRSATSNPLAVKYVP